MSTASNLIQLNIKVDTDFCIKDSELTKMCSDCFHLKENYPWIENRGRVLAYISSMIVEDYVYENQLVGDIEDFEDFGSKEPYCYTGINFMFLDKSHSNEWYMNTGLHSIQEGDLYIHLCQEREKTKNMVYIVITFLFRKKGMKMIKPITELYNKLRVKSSLNLSTIEEEKSEAETLFYNHILEGDTDRNREGEVCLKARWNRLGNRYKKKVNGRYDDYTIDDIEDDDVKKKLFQNWQADIRYSLEELFKRPWLAIPITLTNSMLGPRGVPYISQFAIPFYYNGNHNVPIAAIVIGCVYPSDQVQKFYYDTIPSLHLDKGTLKEILPDFNDVVFRYCSYEFNTVLPLKYVRDNAIFALNGYPGKNFLSLWYNRSDYLFPLDNYEPGQEYWGTIVYDVFENNNNEYFVKPDYQNGLIYINDIFDWAKRNNVKYIYPGDKVKFTVDQNWDLSSLKI